MKFPLISPADNYLSVKRILLFCMYYAIITHIVAIVYSINNSEVLFSDLGLDKKSVDYQFLGTVLSVKDGIATIYGLSEVKAGVVIVAFPEPSKVIVWVAPESTV